MKLKFRMLAGLAFLLINILPISIQNIRANTILAVPEAFNIKAVNGVKYSSGLLSQDRKLKLRPGINRIAMEYEEVFESEYDDNFDIVTSNVFLIKVYLEKNSDYQQRFTKPHNASAAKRYILNPVFEIIKLNESGQKPKSIAFEFQALASNSTGYVVASTQMRPNAILDLSHPAPKKPKLTGKKDPLNAPPQSMAAKMLLYWWDQATPDERKAFLQSINTID